MDKYRSQMNYGARATLEDPPDLNGSVRKVPHWPQELKTDPRTFQISSTISDLSVRSSGPGRSKCCLPSTTCETLPLERGPNLEPLQNGPQHGSVDQVPERCCQDAADFEKDPSEGHARPLLRQSRWWSAKRRRERLSHRVLLARRPR